MQRFVHVDEVVLPLQSRVRSIAPVKLDAILQTAAVEMLLGGRYRRLVEIDTVHPHLRVGPSDRHAREALAAGHVGHAGGRIGLQARVNVRDRREPFAPQQVLEHRPCELRLPLVQLRAVVGIGNAVTAPKGCHQRVDRTNAGDDELPDRSDVVQARLVE